MQIFSVSLEVFDDGGKIGELRSSEREENVVDIGAVWCVLLWNVGWQRVSVQSYIVCVWRGFKIYKTTVEYHFCSEAKNSSFIKPR